MQRVREKRSAPHQRLNNELQGMMQKNLDESQKIEPVCFDVAAAPSLLSLFGTHMQAVNKRTMLSTRLMTCGNSLENGNGAREQRD